MTRAELKTAARASLKGNWGTVIVATLLNGMILLALGLVLNLLAPIATLLVSGPLVFGMVYIYLQVADGQQPQASDLFKGFAHFGNTFLLNFLRNLFVALWSLLLVVPGIMKSYSYAMAFYIMADQPDTGAQEALEKSKELMEGHRMELFMLQLSFFGWFMLCGVTFGLASFYVVPYMGATLAMYYRDLRGHAMVERRTPQPEPEDEPIAEEAGLGYLGGGEAGATVVLRSDRLPAAPVYQGEAGTGVFTGVGGGLAGQVYSLPDAQAFAIGRDPSVSGILADQANASISRCHCTVQYSAAGGCYFVTDLSSNGTFINGIPLEKNTPQRVTPGTLVSLGDGRESFRLE